MNTKREQHQMHDGLHVVGDESNSSQSGWQGSRKIAARNDSVLLRALNEKGLGPVSRAIGHDQSYLSKWRNGDLGLKPDDLFAMLDQLNLKLVSAGPEMRVIDEQDYRTLLNLANKGLRALNNEVMRGE